MAFEVGENEPEALVADAEAVSPAAASAPDLPIDRPAGKPFLTRVK
jgi:hypothetical protein